MSYGERLNPFEAALKRPEVFIGSILTEKKDVLIIKDKAEYKSITYNGGLFSIIREIGSNAIDNKWRDPPLRSIKIECTEEFISFWNDGACIPINKAPYKYTNHKTGEVIVEDLHPAEVFFGDMNAGTNFNDEERKTSGMNGLGAKLANIFSTQFTIEHTNPKEGLKFIQTYSNNAKEKTKPRILKYSLKTGYTKVTFTPDYSFFNFPFESLPYLFDLIRTYAFEIAMVTNVPVKFNDEKIVINSLNKYSSILFPGKKQKYITLNTGNSKDECIIIETEPQVSEALSPNRKSFVNGICTTSGGKHVQAWVSTIIPPLVKRINSKKGNKVHITGKMINPFLTFVIKVEINNAKFSNNTKTELTSPYTLNKTEEFKQAVDSCVENICRWSFVQTIKDNITNKAIEKSGKKEKGIFKANTLSDADQAGKRGSMLCTLFINEGLSAKTLSQRGTDTLEGGRKYYGSFAVKGKVVNVESESKVLKNKEIISLKKILGLEKDVDYKLEENRKKLRYGKRVCIFTDQDDDGFHIRGLLLNFFYKEYPSLLECGYVCSLSTAVAKVFTKDKKQKLFYSTHDLKIWNLSNKGKVYFIEYYKGLGSILPCDAAFYFQNPKFVTYILDGKEKEFMTLAFNKKFSNKRKEWIKERLEKCEELKTEEREIRQVENFVYEGNLSISQFVDEQLIIYHIRAIKRCLPCIWDGFKEAQRKSFFTIRYNKYKRLVDMEKVLGDIKSLTDYHHGAASQEKILKRMACGFVGTNNIPVLEAGGEVGSRSEGGCGAAARYLKTNIRTITRFIFREEDDPILKRLAGGSGLIEFDFFMPIIPMILVNGSIGLACGFSTNIPCFNPIKIVEWIKEWLDDSKPKPIYPFYRGFTGKTIVITKKGKLKRWESIGTLEKRDENYFITEVPVGITFNTVIDYLTYLKYGKPLEGYRWKQTEKKITSFETENMSVNFMNIKFKPLNDFEPDIKTNFKILKKSFPFQNMIAIDECGYPYKFETPDEILSIFCKRRLNYYNLRKEYQINELKDNIFKLENKYLFLNFILNKQLSFEGKEDVEIEKRMLDLGLKKIEESFNYLLSMHITTLTPSKFSEIKDQLTLSKKSLEELEKVNPKDVWIKELDEFLEAYSKFKIVIDKELRSKK